MKKLWPLFLLSILCLNLYGQDQSKKIKQVEKDLKDHPQEDTLRVNRLNELGRLKNMPIGRLDSVADKIISLSKTLNYPEGEVYGLLKKGRVSFLKNNVPQEFAFYQQAATVADKLNDKTHIANVYGVLANFYNRTGDNKQALAYNLKAEAAARLTTDKTLISFRQVLVSNFYEGSTGDYAKSMEWAIKAENTAEQVNDLVGLANAWSAMAGIYTAIGDNANALVYYRKALAANKKLGNTNLEFNLLNRIGEMHRLSGNYPEAIKLYKEGLQKSKTAYNTELTESNLADVYVRLGDLPMAFKYGFKSLQGAKAVKDMEGEEWIEGILARAYIKKNMPDSAIYYAQTGYEKSTKSSTLEFKRDNSEALAHAYALKKDYGNAYKYHLLFISYRDSMLSAQVSNQTALLQYNYALAKNQAQIATLNQDKKNQRYFLTAAAIVIGLVFITVIILIRNNRQKQKANNLLSKQKQIIEEQRDQTNKALSDLQVTQRQLIQSEKMASLGELTAGIAHEIQNPLNFVNNFSEVNLELIGELQEERQGKENNQQVQDELLVDIHNNLEKIRHHGQRADGIVKGMLQHSRENNSTKQPTDINKLADEYLRLAYHGLRAKDKSFNADLVTDFDPDLPLLSVVPQDMGRVLINLFNNAFYAVNQKAKTAGGNYKPKVSVETFFLPLQGVGGLKVIDNGNGIAEHIKDKIMQPFFTTKPTGEGTGLGLSMSYDIVVKGHGGSISVDTKEGEFTEFTLTLPLS